MEEEETAAEFEHQVFLRTWKLLASILGTSSTSASASSAAAASSSSAQDYFRY